MCLKHNNYNIGKIVHRTRTFMGIKYRKGSLQYYESFLVHGDLLLIFLLDVTAAINSINTLQCRKNARWSVNEPKDIILYIWEFTLSLM